MSRMETQLTPAVTEDLAAITGASIVIPAFNEGRAIGATLDRLCAAMSASSHPYEIIVVDDGSTDQTAQVSSSYPVRLLRHPRNKGYGAALKTGARAAQFPVVVTLDADGQHDPADVLRLLELAGSHEMVVGVRTKLSHAPALRRPGKWALGVVASYLAGMRIPDLNSGMRAVRRDLILRFQHILPNGFSFSTTITLAVLKEGYDVAWLPITVSKRVGTSTVHPLRDGYGTLLLILRTILLFDPLKVFLPPSIVLGLIGTGFALYGLLRLGAFPETSVVVIVTAIFLFFFGLLADQISELRRGQGQ
ncbi:MAG: glycosyltransferase family 2 protein [Chloroflexi bacterium]|nr:glycosyltransferase family 2 protein [Chloroflexota bacterium]